MRQVGCDVDRKAVHRHPAAHATAERPDLGLGWPFAGPDADSARLAACVDAQLAQRGDHPAFQGMDEAADILAARFEVEDQIADPLAWPMIGIAAAAAGV